VNQLPPTLLQSLQNLPGFDEQPFIKVHQSGEQITSIRVNSNKFSIANSQLKIENKVEWSSQGYYLKERPSFTLDPLFHAGAYYVQEASSMFLEEALKQSIDLSQPLKVLDLCAAPGGKSTLIQSVISKYSLLISNEVIKTRVNILSENITKWGASNVIVTNNDPKDFQRLKNYFDVIVVDAPCSGSGLFRKDNEAIDEWSEQNVNLCSRRQQRILADIIPALKENGVLIYSTCSYSKQEDEDICDWLIKECQLSIVNFQLPANWNIIESNDHGYRFYPDKVKGEGFFIAAFRKQQVESGEMQVVKNQNKAEKITAKEIEVMRTYLKDISSFSFIKLKDEIISIPSHLANDLSIIQAALYIKKAGTKIGTIIRDELIPDHELALSNMLSDTVFNIEVDEQTALQYLRRAAIELSSEQKGWALLKFQGVPLGWVKLLPGRVNNYYPKEWRILNK